MKTLQNDLTTPEQSKRLIELGVPKNSANHYYGKGGKLRYIDGTIPYSLLWVTGCTPCWSVGRLIEVLHITYKQDWREYLYLCTTETCRKGLINQIMAYLEKYNKDHDFSKLEE